jgi:hypothetical protein
MGGARITARPLRLQTAEGGQPTIEVLRHPTRAATDAIARHHRDGSGYWSGYDAQRSERTAKPGSRDAVGLRPDFASVDGRRVKIARIARHLRNGRSRKKESTARPCQ